jgi:hypothetical protein
MGPALVDVFFRRWMFAGFEQYPAEMDQTFAIQKQCLDGRPACRSEAEDPREVMTPDEVIPPPLAPGMKQRRRLSCAGIEILYLVVLVVVATLAGQSEILKLVVSSRLERDDVLDRERLRRKALLAALEKAEVPTLLPTRSGKCREAGLDLRGTGHALPEAPRPYQSVATDPGTLPASRYLPAASPSARGNGERRPQAGLD